jgi:catechol 2,3-dioxygenase-like lactoylglutathione lyase family enzyme
MPDQPAGPRDLEQGAVTAATPWASSTLIFVRDVDEAIGFYVDRLGFSLHMRFVDDGKPLVAGVSRGDGCSLLLTCQWPDKVGKAVLYTAFDAEEFARTCADLEAKGVALEEGWWGRPLLIAKDPDGNQIYFARPDEA